MTGAGHWGPRSTSLASRAAEERFWQAEIVQHLRRSKLLRVPWSDARDAAARAVKVRTQDQSAGVLFDETGEVVDTAAAFFWRVAEKAYIDYVGLAGSGDGPALRHFSYDMADDEVRLSPVMAA